MIDLFRKIFGKQNSKDDSIDFSLPKDFYDYVKDDTPSAEDEFVKKFISNGGKILICQSPEEIIENLNNIQQENDWQKVFAYEERGKRFIENNDFQYEANPSQADANLLYCEFLIGRTGKILISSNQIGETPLSNFAKNHIFLANSDQLVANLDEAMVKIKNRDQPIPSNIQPISSKNSFNENSYNIYLLIADY